MVVEVTLDPVTRKPGVYSIRNLVNDHIYVGSTKNLRQRWATHCRELRNGTHANCILTSAWEKYGEGSFRFEILEIVGDVSTLLDREQHYIDTMGPVYNISVVAGSPMAGLKHGEQTRQIISATSRKYWDAHPEKRVEAAERMSNRVITEETRKKLSIALAGKPKTSEGHRRHLAKLNAERVFTDEERQRCRERQLKFRHSPESKEKCRIAKEEYWRKVKAGEIVRGAVPRDAEGKFAKRKDKE